MSDWIFWIGFVVVSLILIVSPLLAIIAAIVSILPRDYTRQLRRKLSDFVFWQWAKGSWISTRLHKWLWDSDVNGSRHNGDSIS